MSFNFSPKIVQDGLILCLDAANPKSYPGTGTLWTDLTKNRSNGTLISGATFSGENAGSIVFDGVDDSVESSIYPVPNGFTQYTMSTWIKNINDTGGIINNYDNVADSGFEMELYTGDVYVAFSSSVYGVMTYGITGECVNFTTVFDGTLSGDTNILKLYINGLEVTLSYVGTLPSSISIPDASNTLKIGRVEPIFPFPVRYIQANIANVMTYNRPLSSVEVLQNYNALRSRFGK
jgi:hypothetical protein